jgi:hypothetical protein
MVEVRDLAATILELLHKRGLHEVSIAFLYKSLEKQASYDLVQSAIKFLVDRDLVAPSSYTLTAKGRREHLLKTKDKT